MSYFPDNVDEIRDAINILEKAIAELDGGVSVNVDTLTGTGETGRAVMKAPTLAKARDAIGAGTSSLKLGSTATTAMPGNTPLPDSVTVATIDGAGDTGRKSMAAKTEVEGRAAIGAGTSNLELGRTATTAMPGNTHIPADVPDTRLVPEGGMNRQVLRVDKNGTVSWGSVIPDWGNEEKLATGTETTPKSWSAKVLHDFVAKMIADSAA